MRRRDFLTAATATSLVPSVLSCKLDAAEPDCCGPTYASPQEAMKAERETLAFVPAINVGTGKNKPDYLTTVDVDPKSKTYSKIINRLPMPNVGDELHHFGWNMCSSCHGVPGKHRRYLVVPGIHSGNIHIIDAVNPRKLKFHKVISGEEVKKKTNLSAPHTVHCRPDGMVMISMLGDGKGDAPGGFLQLDEDFNIAGRWAKSQKGMVFNYDYWYQPRHNVMVSREWAAPNTVRPGFKLEDVKAGKYGQRLQFWDWKKREIAQTIDLGAEGLIPLEVRMHHDPDSTVGFVGAALASNIWNFGKDDGRWWAKKTIHVDPVEMDGWPFPVPGLITDLVLSLDDRFLYFSNWLHGDLRQYDVSNPSEPKLTGRLWLGGVLGKGKKVRGKKLAGGPQMLQLSLDGKRLYVTNSLYSSWDNQFYPDIAKQGSYMLQIDCDGRRGGMEVNEDFFVDFGAEPQGPARAHEIRFPGGDSTSDIWV